MIRISAIAITLLLAGPAYAMADIDEGWTMMWESFCSIDGRKVFAAEPEHQPMNASCALWMPCRAKLPADEELFAGADAFVRLYVVAPKQACDLGPGMIPEQASRKPKF